MNNHAKKMIAPIVITVLLVAYYAVYFGLLTHMLSGAVRWLLGLIPLGLAAASVGVCIQRIKEIRSGEEDDLGKY